MQANRNVFLRENFEKLGLFRIDDIILVFLTVAKKAYPVSSTEHDPLYEHIGKGERLHFSAKDLGLTPGADHGHADLTVVVLQIELLETLKIA